MSFRKDKRDRLLIAFDGPDGIGKTTAIGLFSGYLENEYKGAFEIRYVSPFGAGLESYGLANPPGIGFCQSIRKRLDVVQKRADDELDKRVVCELFFLANAEALRVAQTDPIPKGKKRIYLFDRSFISHEVYQKAWAADLICRYDLSVILVDSPESISRFIGTRGRKDLFDPESFEEIKRQVESYRGEYKLLLKLKMADKVEFVDFEKMSREQYLHDVFKTLCQKIDI